MFQSVPGSHRSTGGGTEHPREGNGPIGPLEGSTPAHKGLAHLPWQPAKWEEGKEDRRGTRPPPSFSFPLSFSYLGRPKWGANQPHVAGAFPLLAHMAHIFCRGCPEPLLGTRYVPDTLRNTSNVRILSSYMLIFNFRPFRDSLSCP